MPGGGVFACGRQGGDHKAAAAAKAAQGRCREGYKATSERKATCPSLAPAAERRVRTRRSAASNPQRSGGVSRGKGESKEGLGGNRNPPGPPWPPEAATRLRPQAKAAQERAAKAARQHKNAKQHSHHFPLRQSAALERAAPPPPTPQRSGGGTKGYPRIQGGPRGKSQSPYPSLAAGGCHKAAPQP